LDQAHLAMAQDYERRTTLFPGWREQLVGRLAPRRGDVVLDVGCGTGLNFAALQDRVGPTGRIVGIDQSRELLTVAAHHVTWRGWRNVTLLNTAVEATVLPQPADAALLCAAHDVLQSPSALAQLMRQLRPGAALAAGGWKYPSGWLWPLRALVTALHRPHVADFAGFATPWRLLAEHLSPLHITEVGFGTGYLAHTAGHRG
jgi:ubiquinone/menaquinone biosynthesis C-methylase UbiE